VVRTHLRPPFDRCRGLVSVSGYLIGSRAGYEKYRRDFSRLIRRLASPRWAFDDATIDVASF
jgi:hypothetical protein